MSAGPERREPFRDSLSKIEIADQPGEHATLKEEADASLFRLDPLGL